MVQMDDDQFISLCWDRINEFPPAKSYPDSFWTAIFNYLKELEWLSPQYNYPSYIVDNIAVNGDFISKEDFEAENPGKGVDPEWNKFGDYYCRGNMGL